MKNKQDKKQIFMFIFSVVFTIYFVVMFIFLTEGLDRTDELRLERKSIQSCVLESSKNLDVSGSFILGIGSVGGSTYNDIKYYFYMKSENGYKLKSIDTNYVEIVETNNIEPCIEGYFTEYGDFYNELMCIGANEKYTKKVTSYTLYVPEGTLKQSFDINLVDAR